MKRNSLFFRSRKLGSGVRIITALLLVANSFLPWIQAFAASGQDLSCTTINGIEMDGSNQGSEIEAMIGDACYTTLWAAIDAAWSSDTVKLLKDVTTASAIAISKTLTLDLNGYSIIKEGAERVIEVNANWNLTIKDTSSNWDWKIKFSNENAAWTAIK